MIIEGGQEKYEIIDFAKGFAILTIVVMHLLMYVPFPQVMNKMISLGGTGVHIFFLCSGFGLYISQCRRKLKFIPFIKKRFSKIYIPYIVWVIIIACIPLTFNGSISERVVALMSHIFLFKMFINPLEISFSYPLWYMSTLFQFYFAFLFLCIIKEKVKNKVFISLCFFVSAGWWIISFALGICELRIWGSFFLQYLWEFALGMCLADVLSKGKTIKIKNIYLVMGMVIGLLVGGLLGVKGGYLRTFNDLFIMSGYTCLIILLYQGMPVLRKIIVKINNISFEWYLVHTTCFAIVYQYAAKGMVRGFQAVFAFLVSIVVAVLYHKFVLNYLRK